MENNTQEKLKQLEMLNNMLTNKINTIYKSSNAEIKHKMEKEIIKLIDKIVYL